MGGRLLRVTFRGRRNARIDAELFRPHGVVDLLCEQVDLRTGLVRIRVGARVGSGSVLDAHAPHLARGPGLGL